VTRLVDNKRRWLIGGGLLAAIGVSYSGAVIKGALTPCGSVTPRDERQARLQLERIGAVYLAQLPRAARLGVYKTALSADAAAFETRLSRLAANLPEATRADFESGRTVSCDRWILAKSEADFCALIAARV
jgi:hypothetical protein